jgi:hypothetical protein
VLAVLDVIVLFLDGPGVDCRAGGIEGEAFESLPPKENVLPAAARIAPAIGGMGMSWRFRECGDWASD